MAQSQPVIPVTMQYDNNNGLNHGFHNIEREVHRTSDHIKHDINKTGDNVIAQLDRQANADQAQTRSSQIETRQAVERNADYLNNTINDTATRGLLATQNTSTQGLLATQNTSTQGLLATQNTATATQLAVQNTTSDLNKLVQNNASQNERIAGETRSILYNQMQILLTENKSMQLQEAQTKAAIQLQTAQLKSDMERHAANYRSSIELQASNNKGSIELQASNNKASLELQASQYKAYLENHITKTSADGILKTVETSAKILEKIAECCCENKLAHANSQQIIIQNSLSNQNNILNNLQSNNTNQLQQALNAANQEALLARIAAASAGVKTV
jgi:hypothetical protein